MVFSVSTPAAGGCEGEAGHLVAEHSPWGASGKRQVTVRVLPSGVGLKTGFMSSFETKSWTEKLDRCLDVRTEPSYGEGEVRSRSRLLSVGIWEAGYHFFVLIPFQGFLWGG